MTEERAKRLTLIAFAIVTLAAAAGIALWEAQTESAIVTFSLWPIVIALSVLGILMLGTVVWALAGKSVALAVFRPVSSAGTVEASGDVSHEAGALTVVWERAPRWTPRLAGAAILGMLFVLSAAGIVPVSIAYALMAGLTLAALVLGLAAPDLAEEDRRSDLALTMVAVWALLYLIKSSLFLVMLMASSWVAFIFGTGVVLFQGYSWRWIGLGLLGLIVLNLVLFFALYRP